MIFANSHASSLPQNPNSICDRPLFVRASSKSDCIFSCLGYCVPLLGAYRWAQEINTINLPELIALSLSLPLFPLFLVSTLSPLFLVSTLSSQYCFSLSHIIEKLLCIFICGGGWLRKAIRVHLESEMRLWVEFWMVFVVEVAVCSWLVGKCRTRAEKWATAEGSGSIAWKRPANTFFVCLTLVR